MKHLAIVAGLAVNAAAWAHPGHGIDAPSHWHATDAWGLVLALAAAAAAWCWGHAASERRDDPGRVAHRRPRPRAEPRPAHASRWWSQNTGDRPIQVGSHYHFAETNGGARASTAPQRAACA